MFKVDFYQTQKPQSVQWCEIENKGCLLENNIVLTWSESEC